MDTFGQRTCFYRGFDSIRQGDFSKGKMTNKLQTYSNRVDSHSTFINKEQILMPRTVSGFIKKEFGRTVVGALRQFGRVTQGTIERHCGRQLSGDAKFEFSRTLLGNIEKQCSPRSGCLRTSKAGIDSSL
jgi:hypothetical protein